MIFIIRHYEYNRLGISYKITINKIHIHIYFTCNLSKYFYLTFKLKNNY